MKKFLSILLCLITLTVFAACSSDYNEVALEPEESAIADFSVNLFKKTFAEDENKNLLISPLSVMLALAMTANGADNNTLLQMEKVLGGSLTINELNEYLYNYAKNLPSGEKSELDIANSIWFREDKFIVSPDFLQLNADYYGADAYEAAFDEQTVEDINNWVRDNTKGLIDKLLDEISEDSLMYLINTVLFDAEWQTVYGENQIRNKTFTAFDKKEQSVPFMHSSEYQYLTAKNAVGVIKPYFGNRYSFAALLPDKSVPINKFIASLSGVGFISAIRNAETIEVKTSIPKFTYDYEITLNETLKKMGMPDAFDELGADFIKMGTAIGYDNVYIGKVLHKTYISVDELGTKAGAVTSVEMDGATSAGGRPKYKVVDLDRPFVYAIIDNETGFPIFMGAVLEI